METNLNKAKRLLRNHLSKRDIHILEDGFVIKMLELAAEPDEKPIETTGDLNDPDFTVG